MWLEGRYQPAAGRVMTCVNPLNWQLGGSAGAALSLGALPAARPGQELRAPVAHLTGARCDDGVLDIDIPLAERSGFADLLTLFGSYHIFDYNLFYVNIRTNALERINAWRARVQGRRPVSESDLSEAGTPRSLYRVYVIAVLVVVYTFNFIDRVGLGILVGPMKAELHLTDTQIGFVGGTALALFYTAFGIPAGRLADRYRRIPIITGALALWSAATAACGLAHSFGALFAARLTVGVGEAGGVAPVYSLLADYFPPRSRARAIACFSLGIPFGGALGVFLGGYLAA